MAEIFHVVVRLDGGYSINTKNPPERPVAVLRDDDGALVFTKEQARDLAEFLAIGGE